MNNIFCCKIHNLLLCSNEFITFLKIQFHSLLNVNLKIYPHNIVYWPIYVNNYTKN